MKDVFRFDLKREEKDFVLADGCPSFSGLSGRDMLDLWEITAAFGSSLEDAECCEFESRRNDLIFQNEVVRYVHFQKRPDVSALSLPKRI